MNKRRRANGEGSIFQRKNGSWEEQFFLKYSDGVKRRTSVSAQKKSLLRAKKEKKIEKAKRQLSYSPKDWTVADYLNYWMQEVQLSRIRESTLVTYMGMIKNHITPVLGAHKLYNLSVMNVRCGVNTWKENGCGGATIQKCLRILSTCLTNAMREELIFRNVAQLVEKPKYTPNETEIWTVEQARIFLREVKNHPQYIAFLFLLLYAPRRGETLGLRWSDIDFEKKQIHVRQQIV